MYIDKDRNIQTTAYRKETDCERYLHSKFEHSLCLKESVPFSQALRLKRTCSTITAFEDESTEFVQKKLGRWYKADDIQEKIEHASNSSREILLQETQNNSNVTCIPLIKSYNRSASNVSQIMKKNWSIFKINEKLAKTFEGELISFKRKRKPREQR